MVNDRLVVRWGYTHTGGELITSVTVLFSPDTSATKLSFSEVPGAQLDQVEETEREDSIPVPEAGITYKFSVRAGNSLGETEVDCPSLSLPAGLYYGLSNIEVNISKPFFHLTRTNGMPM